jgi:trehalose 6-phosphate synthase
MAIAVSSLRKIYDLERRLVVVSNRVPGHLVLGSAENAKSITAGGLVSGLYPSLQKRGGLWFGWSGESTPVATPRRCRLGSFDLVTIDLTEKEVNDFYIEFSNRVLWPLFHGFPDYVRISPGVFQTYEQVNRHFARSLFPLLRSGDLIWVHDYHLIPLGIELRHLGWNGHLGFFLHIPFPPAYLFTILPWAKSILGKLMVYDLLGFHTRQYCLNFVDAMNKERGGAFDGQTYSSGTSSVRVGVYPIGTDPDHFQRWAGSPEAVRYGNQIRRSVGTKRIVLGVDRLDYTKGIPERLLAFEQLLERYPSWRRNVSMIQISAPSRTNIAEYKTKKCEVDRLVRKINARFSEEGWIPVRHWYQSYSQETLSALYREADVCLVTPLRDGMNLIAKEYIASQGEEPGVLVLSRFCGAAEELREAVIINPSDIGRTATALKYALEMPLGERRERWHALSRRVHAHTAQTWSDRFLADLLQTGFELKQTG